MKILIIVLSYDDNGGIYSKFYESQKNTWDSIDVEGVNTFYLFGNHDKNEIVDDKILTEVVDYDTSSCGYKTIKSFELTKHLEYDYIFRTNSSSYIDKQLLVEYVDDKPLNNYYSGVIGDYRGLNFASGSGYFLSKNLVDLVIEKSNLWNHVLIDDVAIADLLRTLDITPTKNSRHDVLHYDDNTPNNYYHYRLRTSNRDVDINNMFNIFKLKQNKTK